MWWGPGHGNACFMLALVQERIAELREEVRWHEQRRLQAWAAQDGAAGRVSPPAAAQQPQCPAGARTGAVPGTAPALLRPSTAAADMAASLAGASEGFVDAGSDAKAPVPVGTWPGLDADGDGGGRSPAGSWPAADHAHVQQSEVVSSHAALASPGRPEQAGRAADAHVHITAVKAGSKAGGSRPSSSSSSRGKGARADAASPRAGQAPRGHRGQRAGSPMRPAVVQAAPSGQPDQEQSRTAGAAGGAGVQPGAGEHRELDDAAAAAAAEALLAEQEGFARPQRAPQRPLPPVPRFDKCAWPSASAAHSLHL